MEILKSKLAAGAAALNIEINKEQIEKFLIYTRELLKWNKVMNLTAITDIEEIATKHYIDSLAILKYAELQKGAIAADVGCGAGFPGFPIKIVREDIELTCIDSLAKRLNFLSETSEKMDFKKCSFVHARAEEIGAKEEYREKYDYSFARAVAKLRVLSEYCLPLVKIGGYFIAMKAGNAESEINESKNSIIMMGGEINDVKKYVLPESDISRTMIIIKKIKATPQKFPRNTARIAKSPL